jgi:SpoVK/Ycf46/Vps4 family AAA+-type ATPase
MALKTFIGSSIYEFNNKDLFLKLQNKLSDKYEDSEELVFLLGNIKINDFNIDALIIKSNCILMLCLNNYSGELYYSETGKWKIGESKIEINANKDVNPLKSMKLKLDALQKFLFDQSILSNKNELFSGPIAVSLFDNNLIFDNNALSGKIKKWLKISDVNSVPDYVDICFQENIYINKKKFEEICSLLNVIEFDVNSYYRNQKSRDLARKDFYSLQKRKLGEYLLKLKFELELMSFQDFSDFSKEVYRNYGISMISEINGSLEQIELYKTSIVKPYNQILANKINKGKKVLDKYREESELNIKKGVEFIVLHANQLQEKIEIDKSRLYEDKEYIDFLLNEYFSEFKEIEVELDFERYSELLHNMIYVQGLYSKTHIEEYFYFLLVTKGKDARVLLCNYLLALNELLKRIFENSFKENSNNAFGFDIKWSNNIMNFTRMRLLGNSRYCKEESTTRYFFNKSNVTEGKFPLKYYTRIPFPGYLNDYLIVLLNQIKELVSDIEYVSILKITNISEFIDQNKLEFDKFYLISLNYNRVFNLKIDFNYLNYNKIYQIKKGLLMYRSSDLRLTHSFNVIFEVLNSEKLQKKLDVLKANSKSIDSSILIEQLKIYKLLESNDQVIKFNDLINDLKTNLENIDVDLLKRSLIDYTSLHSFFENSLPLDRNILLFKGFYNKIKDDLILTLSSSLGSNSDNSIKDNFKSSKKNNTNDIPTTKKETIVFNSTDELIGYEDVKLNIREHLQNYFDKEISFHLKLSNPDGLLFYGLPGCGKTFFANWIAKTINYKLIEVPRASFGSQYVDGAMNKLMEKLKEIHKASPSVVFFDEFDSVATNRDKKGSSHNENDKVVNTLLQEIPKLIEKGNIIIGATNFIENLDAAVIRTGRFGPKIPIFPPLPNERATLFINTVSNTILAESPIRNFLIKNNMFESDFVKTYTDKMLLFSNSDVVNVAETFCKKLYKLHNAGTLDLEYLDLESDINKFKIAIEQFEKFYYEISLFNSEIFYDRINNLKMEIDIYKNGGKRKKKIGY